jgi:SAM-dependent methyltransferase
MSNHNGAGDGLARILDTLACPACHSELNWNGASLQCASCGRAYPVIDGIPDLRVSVPRAVSDMEDWSRHWSGEHQQSAAQTFFSFYRKAVFARTVAYFVNRYFPAQGLFVEAGCGTAETSMRIDKHGGARTLVALDIILPVLKHAHPIMDERVCGDIFNLPFQDNSMDGLWNVGVMEHFTPEQVDQIMREYHRVLKDGAPIILLWVGATSLPQKALRLVEAVANARKPGEDFRFHPPEINLLKSSAAGNAILRQYDFQPVHVDFGLRSLMAFITLVGTKAQRPRAQHIARSKEEKSYEAH